MTSTMKRSEVREDDSWMRSAACLGAPEEVFFPPEPEDDHGDVVIDPPYPSKEALKYCNGCVVRAQCLARAFETNAPGVWGGTSEYQRRQLKSPRRRASCPACTSRELVLTTDGYELCLGCGISWET